MAPISTLLWLAICVVAFAGSAAEVCGGARCPGACTGARCASGRTDTLRRPAVPYTIIHPSVVARQENARSNSATVEAQAQAQAQARDGCAGVENCAQARRRPCAGRECITHMRDGTERAPREFGTQNGIQLACDVRPGEEKKQKQEAVLTFFTLFPEVAFNERVIQNM